MVHETRAGTAVILGRFGKHVLWLARRRGVHFSLVRVIVCLIVVAGMSSAHDGIARHWLGVMLRSIGQRLRRMIRARGHCSDLPGTGRSRNGWATCL